MNTILYTILGTGPVSGDDLAALSPRVVQLEVPTDAWDVSTLRGAVEAVPGPVSAFLLSVGTSAPPTAGGVDWELQVLKPLKQAFGLLTGAGQRFRQEGCGTIAVLLPSAAIGAAEVATPQLVLLRSIVGMAEALRAELEPSGVRVSLVFYDNNEVDSETLAARLSSAVSAGALYSLSADITAKRIAAYFAPLLSALDQTSAGTPLPDIGPMAAVYDLAAAGAPGSRRPR